LFWFSVIEVEFLHLFSFTQLNKCWLSNPRIVSPPKFYVLFLFPLNKGTVTNTLALHKYSLYKVFCDWFTQMWGLT